MDDNIIKNMHNSADYLSQLLKDKKQLSAFPNVFLHSERLLDEEINKVRVNLFQKTTVKKEPLILPEPDGNVITQTEKVYVPVKDHPDFNFVGRILGPRGTTVKELEKETGCKIMVRGKGSMRDKKKEDQNRGKPNWEHLADELHVLVTVEDTPNRATEKLKYAVDEINKLLVPSADGVDELKKKQLMELAIMNGTYRDTSGKSITGYPLGAPFNSEQNIYSALLSDCQTRILGHPMALASPALRSPVNPLGVPLILTPRMTVPTSSAMMNGSGPPPLIAPNEAGLLYSPYHDYHQYAALTSPLLTSDYQAAVAEHLSSPVPGTSLRPRRHLTNTREHPYQRAGSLPS